MSNLLENHGQENHAVNRKFIYLKKDGRWYAC